MARGLLFTKLGITCFWLMPKCIDCTTKNSDLLIKVLLNITHILKFFDKFSTLAGRIGLTLNNHWYQAKDELPANKDAAQRATEFMLAWFAEPIFGPTGDYPQVMKSRV